MRELTPLELENLRKAFRLAMWANFRKPGEPLAALVQRLKGDAATAKVATQLQCSVDVLLKGLGTPEEYQSGPDVDEGAVVATLVQRLEKTKRGILGARNAAEFMASSGVQKGGTQMGVLVAPKLGEQKGEISSKDPAAAQALKEKMDELRGIKVKVVPKKPDAKGKGKIPPKASVKGRK